MRVSAMDTLRDFMCVEPAVDVISALKALGVRPRINANLPDGISGHLDRHRVYACPRAGAFCP